MRPVVVGTAGHIDHGKTALVRRLTGIDTDRLKEEKERGISIDLGFAHLTLPSGRRVAIVDVPGHERFVKNMLAGATGIDLVLLVVAADEGVMPQTLEHLAIVDLLGVRRGVVALTKSDLVTPDMLELARDEVESLLQPTSLRGSPIIPVSSTTGAGVADLLASLDSAAAGAGDAAGGGETADAGGAGRRDEKGPARLPIDRVFSIEGIGTVVTGTLWSGTIGVGDSLVILPGGRGVRVRQVEVHDESVPAAVAGQRTAVAIHGAARDEVARGEWLVTSGRFLPADTLDVRLSLLRSAVRPLANRTRVRIHLGASEALGRIVLLQGRALAPGESAPAQLRLEGPLVAVPGDRMIVRSYSPAITIAGATVLDPSPTKRSRLDAAGTERLQRLETGTLEDRIEILARESRLAGLTPEEAALRLGLGAAEVERAVEHAAGILRLRGGRLLARENWSLALDRVAEETKRYADRHQLRSGIPKGELKSILQRDLPGPIFDEALETLLREKRLEVKGDRIGLPQAAPTLTPEQIRALAAIEGRLRGAGFQVPETTELIRDLPPIVKPTELIRYLVDGGQAVRVTSELLYPADLWAEIEARVRGHFTREPALTMAALKDMLQVSRKYAVPILEHLDRSGFTRREGDVRVPGPKFGGKVR